MSAPSSPDDRSIQAMAAELARMQRRLDALETGTVGPRLGASSIQDGTLPIYNSRGEIVLVFGKQQDGTFVGGNAIGPQAPPEIPAAPTVVAGLGDLKVSSNGSIDPPWPSNMSHINVWLGDGADGDYDHGRVVGVIIGSQDSGLVISGLDTTPYRVWLTAVNTSGVQSAMSAIVVATPTQVVEADILDGAITELKLADEAVTAAKIATEAVQNYHFGDKVVDLRALDDEAVGPDQIIADAILARHIGAGQVTTAALAALAVQAGNIAAAAIQAGHLAAGSVTTEALLALAITADKLAVNSVTAGAIQAGAVTADAIRAGEVLANISLKTGVAGGPQILISGPANEVRFFPASTTAIYGRIFAYTPNNYPNDVVVEYRAVNSAATNVIPRMYQTPDKLVLTITDAADDTFVRGGHAELSQGGAFYGYRTGAAQSGLLVDSTGSLAIQGIWTNYSPPKTNAGVFTFCLSVRNTSATKYIMRIVFVYGVTMDTVLAPVMSAGMEASAQGNYSVRDEGLFTTGFIIRMGLTTGSALKPGETIRCRCWAFRTDSEHAFDVVGVDL